MMIFQVALALIPGGENKAGIPAGKPRELTDTLTEAVAGLFFSVGLLWAWRCS